MRLVYLLLLTLLFPTSVFAQPYRTVSYDASGRKVITFTCDPNETPDWFKENYLKEEGTEKAEISEKKADVASEIQRTPPAEGSIPAKIEAIDANGKEIFTENYRIGYAGQCTWYAKGRFREVNGVELPTIGYAKDWLMAPLVSDKVDVCLDVNAVPEYSIAVYAPKTDNSLKGHVVFVEYVERDKDGNPVNIYYTDANGKHDTEKNKYTKGCDGQVIKESFQEFRENRYLKLVGYVVKK